MLEMSAEQNTVPVISASWPWKIEDWHALKGGRDFEDLCLDSTGPLLGHGAAVAQTIPKAADTIRAAVWRHA
jgi:hypothetical protein